MKQSKHNYIILNWRYIFVIKFLISICQMHMCVCVCVCVRDKFMP